MVLAATLAALALTLYSFLDFFKSPCDSPLEYSVGRFDSRFGVSESDFKSSIVEAEAVWEDALGRDFFKYKPNADFKINLIYDERQLATMQKQKTESGLSAAENILDNLDRQFDLARRNYEKDKTLYESATALFETRKEQYEALVNEWNRRGGAPPDVYNDLQAQAKVLNLEATNLNQAAVSLNAEAEELNIVLEKRNQAARAYNQVARSYNQAYGSGLEFNQAEYNGGDINIYQFGNENDLLLALTHELGHALGMEHVEQAGSVMYYITGSDYAEEVSLSEADLEELKRVCDID